MTTQDYDRARDPQTDLKYETVLLGDFFSSRGLEFMCNGLISVTKVIWCAGDLYLGFCVVVSITEVLKVCVKNLQRLSHH